MGLGAIKDSIIRKLALRWLRGRVDNIRTGEGTLSKALKFLDGWKFIIGGTILFVVKVWDGMHSTHYGEFANSLLATFGWDSDGGGFAAEAAGPVIMLVGIVHQFIKAGKQAHAGAPIASLLSAEGYVIKHEVDLAQGKPSAEATEVKAIAAAEVAP